MPGRFAFTIAAAALAIASLGGCSPQDSNPGQTGSEGTPPGMSAETGAPQGAPGPAELATGSTSLGTIVVDGDGLTLYVFDNDTPDSGMSSCTGVCLSNWPPLTTAGEPAVEGVTGEVGTIPAANGSEQVTLNGWPLYYYAGDTAPGDVNGQGLQNIWWVVSPSGEKITG